MKTIFKTLSLLCAIIMIAVCGAIICKWYLQVVYNFPGLPQKANILEIIAVGFFMFSGFSIIFYALSEFVEKRNYKKELDQYFSRLKDENKKIRDMYYNGSMQ